MKCKKHSACRKVMLSFGAWEFIECPWCTHPLNLLSGARWCPECFTKFEIDKGIAHFSKFFPTSFAEKIAIAAAAAESKLKAHHQ